MSNHHTASLDHHIQQSRKVKALEAQNGQLRAEIDRLRALVEVAYREGCGVLCIESQEDEDVAWEKSDAKKAMGAQCP